VKRIAVQQQRTGQDASLGVGGFQWDLTTGWKLL
jgi:hypothetical protein